MDNDTKTNPEKKEINPMLEIDAMKKVAEALEPLDPNAIGRVIRWASELYSFVPVTTKANSISAVESSERDSMAQYTELADFYSAASPTSDAEKALVVGYWYQYIMNEPDLDSQRINTQLKHLGESASNITVAFSSLMNRKPQLAIQTRKSGSTKQARKKYKLTEAGRKFVEEMLRKGNGNQ